MKIWVFAESDEDKVTTATYEMLTKARELGDTALPETPDVAIVAVPAELATQSIEDLAARGCKAVVMFTAGFAEMDDAGAVAQQKLVGARRHAVDLPTRPRPVQTWP